MKILLNHNRLFIIQDGQKAPTPKSLSPAPGQGQGDKGASNPSTQAKGGPNAATTQDGSPAKKGPAPNPCLNQLPLLLGAGVLFYFLLIRPQQKQEKQRKAILASVKKGDKIVTTGGIHGEVVSLDDRCVTIKFGNDTNQRMVLDRAAIGRVPAREAELPKKGGG
jgi:preprotein translocase subunit YajC